MSSNAEPDLALAMALLASGSVLLLLLGLSEIYLRDRSDIHTRRRVRRFVPEGAAEARLGGERRSLGEWLVKPVLAAVGSRHARLASDERAARMRDTLMRAGEPFDLDVVEYWGLRIVTSALVAMLALVLLLPFAGEVPAAILLVLAAALTGYALPSLWLRSLVRRRKDAMRRALPAALDILTLSMEAGLGFDAAIAHVAQRWHNPLSREFRRWFIELQMGRQRREAMTEFAKRTGLDELQRFVAAVAQAEPMGVPVVKVLRDQAMELRVARRQRAETLARTAPVKMIFPMVLLVFPALFIVLLGPAAPRLLAIFSLSP